MKSSIRVVKHNSNKAANQATPENKEPAELNTRKVASTVKVWIAELQERKRTHSHSFTAATGLILIAVTVALAQTQASTTERKLTPEEQAIKVTIETTSGFLGRPANRYKVGEQIPVTITMTNTAKNPVYTCVSSDLYQDLPKLTRDGRLVPYLNWQSYEELNAKRNHICEKENLPEAVLLRPNEPTVADWFVLVDDKTTGAEFWYDSLPPDKYELTILRRLSCCDGPMVESNKTSFEVVP